MASAYDAQLLSSDLEMQNNNTEANLNGNFFKDCNSSWEADFFGLPTLTDFGANTTQSYSQSNLYNDADSPVSNADNFYSMDMPNTISLSQVNTAQQSINQNFPGNDKSLVAAETPMSTMSMDVDNSSSPDTKQPATRAKGRRGRKPSSLPEEVKRSRFLERNRMAASKCRQKKKEWTDDLVTQAKELARKNHTLTQLNNDLQQQVTRLRAESLKHLKGECSVTDERQDAGRSAPITSQNQILTDILNLDCCEGTPCRSYKEDDNYEEDRKQEISSPSVSERSSLFDRRRTGSSLSASTNASSPPMSPTTNNDTKNLPVNGQGLNELIVS